VCFSGDVTLIPQPIIFLLLMRFYWCEVEPTVKSIISVKDYPICIIFVLLSDFVIMVNIKDNCYTSVLLEPRWMDIWDLS
jgi:hypothetical protein